MTTQKERTEYRDALIRQRALDLLRLHHDGFRDGWKGVKELQPATAWDKVAVLSLAATLAVKKRRPSLASAVDELIADPHGADKDSPAYRAMGRAYDILEMLVLRWACEQAARRRPQ